MTDETVVEAGEAKTGGGRAIVPIVRTETVAGRGGVFIRAEPIALLIAGDGSVLLLSQKDADVPDDVLAEAAKRARDALASGA